MQADEFEVIGEGKWPVRTYCKRIGGVLTLSVVQPTGELDKRPHANFGSALQEANRLTKEARKVA